MCEACGYPDHFGERRVSKSQAQILFEAYVAATGAWYFKTSWEEVSEERQQKWAEVAELYAEALTKTNALKPCTLTGRIPSRVSITNGCCCKLCKACAEALSKAEGGE